MHRLVRLIRCGRGIWRVEFLRRGIGRKFRRSLELARIFTRQGGLHEIHPDRQCRVGAGFFRTQ
jgi:hypothetical protein